MDNSFTYGLEEENCVSFVDDQLEDKDKLVSWGWKIKKITKCFQQKVNQEVFDVHLKRLYKIWRATMKVDKTEVKMKEIIVVIGDGGNNCEPRSNSLTCPKDNVRVLFSIVGCKG